MRPSVEFIFVNFYSAIWVLFWHRQIALSPTYKSCLFRRILIKSLFVFFSLRILSFMRRRLSGAKIQDVAFDAWRFRVQTYVILTIESVAMS